MRTIRRLALGASVLASLTMLGSAGGGALVSAQDQPTVRIGSDGFYESALVAEIYAQALEAAGFDVDRQLRIGTRVERAGAFTDGLIDMTPEYVGSGHAIFDPSVATTDGEQNARLLEDAYAAAGTEVTVLGLTEGQDSNAAAVRADTAEELGLSAMSDLADVQDQLRYGLTPECDTNPFCKDALETYGVVWPPEQRETLAACSGPMAEALNAEVIDFAWLCSTQPAIKDFGFVVLEDDLNTQAAENMAPLVRNDFLEQVDGGAETIAAILDPVSAAVTTDVLFDLGVRVGIDQEDLEDVAAEFLASLSMEDEMTDEGAAEGEDTAE
jgi:osmoprotectant transport system substrate-binding protein